MKIDILKVNKVNTGELVPQWEKCNHLDKTTGERIPHPEDHIVVKKGRYMQCEISHALRSGDKLYYRRKQNFSYEGKVIYWFGTFSQMEHGKHIGFNWWQHQYFLWMQGDHWFQKEENIRYLVNLLFLTLGVWIGIKSI